MGFVSRKHSISLLSKCKRYGGKELFNCPAFKKVCWDPFMKLPIPDLFLSHPPKLSLIFFRQFKIMDLDLYFFMSVPPVDPGSEDYVNTTALKGVDLSKAETYGLYDRISLAESEF